MELASLGVDIVLVDLIGEYEETVLVGKRDDVLDVLSTWKQIALHRDGNKEKSFVGPYRGLVR